MSSLATEQPQLEYKMLRFHDSGMNNAQSYQYDDNGDLIGDYGEHWIVFKGNVMRPPDSHGESAHIHVPPQTGGQEERGDPDDLAKSCDAHRYPDSML